MTTPLEQLLYTYMTNSNSFSGVLEQLDNTLEPYFKDKAPQLPTNIKEILVALAPWLTILSIIFSLPIILGALGLGAVLAPLSFLTGGNMVSGFAFWAIFLIILIVLQILSVPGLMNRTKAGWKYSFYANIASAVYALMRMDIISMIIGTLIGLYFLYQVKEYYK